MDERETQKNQKNTHTKTLIFKSNLELTLSSILKQRGLYEPKHVAEQCRCLKI